MRVGLLVFEEIQRLRQRHTRVQKCFELGVEEQKILAADPL